MTQANDDFTNKLQEARAQIEQKQYTEAISNLDEIIQNDNNNVYASLLRGKAYSQSNNYKLALTDLEKALDLYQQQDDKKYQVYVLFELTFVYSFNGKTKEGFLAQQESIRIAKQLDLPEDDPLYSYVSNISQMSDESLDKWQSQIQNMNSIPSWDKFGFMGRLMGYSMKGKWQFYFVWLTMFLPGLAVAVIFSPIWLPWIVYQMWQRRSRNNEQ
ncbi:MAG: tetratricopeptide repeat protein [Cyanobacteria bacterium P01_G01_bin.19]